MRSPKQIAIDIMRGDKKAKAELEKMMGVSFEDMTIKQRRLGVEVLSATEDYWNVERLCEELGCRINCGRNGYTVRVIL